MVVDEDLRHNYIKGVIAVDIFDTKSKAPVWHGKASRSLDESEVSSGEANIVQAVRAVLSEFPPKN